MDENLKVIYMAVCSRHKKAGHWREIKTGDNWLVVFEYWQYYPDPPERDLVAGLDWGNYDNNQNF